MAMMAAAILSPMLLLPASGQEQEHQGQTQVSQMTLIAEVVGLNPTRSISITPRAQLYCFSLYVTVSFSS